MSLLLFWENPQETYNPRSSRVIVFRDGDNGRITVTRNATWGFFEDTETDDLEAIYEIQYEENRGGGQGPLISNKDVARYKREADQAIFTFQRRTFAGIPDAGRGINITNYSSTAGGHAIRLLTNLDGVAKYALKQGSRVLVHINGEHNALDTIVPHKKDVSWADLVSAGSWVLANRRGIF